MSAAPRTNYATNNHTAAASSRQAGSDVGRITSELQSRLGASRFERWFAGDMFTVSATTLTVGTESGFAARWIESQFGAVLRDVAGGVLGSGAQVVVSAEPARGTPVVAPRGPRRPPAAPVRPDTAPPQRNRRRVRRRRLDELVIGDCNRLAAAAAHRLVHESAGVGVSPLFVHGECGVGKTHVLQGICDAAAHLGGEGTVRYLTGEQFTNEYIAAARDHALDTFRRRMRRLDLLAIDDVQFLSNKEKTLQEFHHTLDDIALAGGRVVLAANDHPRAIPSFSRALVSRLLSGMVVQIERPDRATRRDIIIHVAQERSLPMDDEAIDRLAATTAGSVRELEGSMTMLTALHALIDGGRGRIDAALVDTMHRDGTNRRSMPVRVPTIIECVCTRIGVTPDDVLGSSRHERVVVARSLIAYLARDLTSRSFPEIARELGRTCHSTVHSANARILRQLESGASVTIGTPPATIAISALVDEMRAEILALR